MVEDLFWDEFALLASPVLYFAQASVIFELASIRRPVGLMDKASASGAGDSRFESWAGQKRCSDGEWQWCGGGRQATRSGGCM